MAALEDAAEDDVEHIFNEEFREELRNRGRLHFEKILGENAMFLQQDLRLTTSQLNDYMKEEISRELKDAFANYQSAITDAKQMAVESIEKTKTAIDDERKSLVAKLEQEVSEERDRRIKQFDERMAQIVNHYVLSAIGNQIDLNDQLEYIMSEMEANKQAILEDIKNGS
jgi:translation initiation factor 6 (eIF-6)